MSSSRRVKKGPGRRPQSAKRQRFMELRERGWSILAAAREVGVSRTTGNNWSRGYKIYRNGRSSGSCAPLERLAVRQISARFLSQDERIEIADLRQRGLEHPADRAPAGPGAVDDLAGAAPQRDHGRGTARSTRTAARPRVGPAITGAASTPTSSCAQLVAELLSSGGARSRSAVTCAALPRRAGHVAVSREHLPGRLPAGIGAAAALAVGAAPPFAAAHRSRSPPRASAPERRRPRFEQPMLTIHERPFPPEDRSEAGHWEGDLIIGKDQRSAIGTLVERQTRMVRLLHLPAARRRHAARRPGPGWPTCRRRCCGRSPGTRAPRWPATSTITADTRRAGLLLRLPLALAARLEREHQRAAARLLPQGHRPEHPHTRPPAGRRERAQQPTPKGPRRPHPSRAVRRAASLQRPSSVATLTRTHPGARGSRFNRR